MKIINAAAVLVAMAGFAAAGPVAGTGGITVVSTFNPDEGGSMNSIGYDQTTDEVFVHFEFNADYHVYAPDGTFLRTIPKPLPGGNDDDITFLVEPATIGGVELPAGTLVLIENDVNPGRLFAVDKADGTLLATQFYNAAAPGAGWVGGTQLSGSTFAMIDYIADAIEIVDGSTDGVLSSFLVRPPGSPGFLINYGDVEVLREDGNLYLVSEQQNAIRALEPDGAWVGDFQLGPLGVNGMSGIAFDDARGEAWVSSINGTVYRLAGFPPDGCVLADLAPPLGVLDLNDVGGFVDAFLNGAPVADLAEPFGVFDLGDIAAFIDGFLAGCP